MPFPQGNEERRQEPVKANIKQHHQLKFNSHQDGNDSEWLVTATKEKDILRNELART